MSRDDQPMALQSGPAARDALLTLLGDHQIQLETVVELLIAKGIVTEGEWDAAMAARYEAGRPELAEWARRCMDPPNGAALDRFFEA